MADESKQADKPTENEQLELDFPSPDNFPSYDEVESDEGQAQLPDDSFDEAAVTEHEGGCCV